MIESTYSEYLQLTGEPIAAAMLTLAKTIEQKPDTVALTVKQAAKALGASTDAIYDLCRCSVCCAASSCEACRPKGAIPTPDGQRTVTDGGIYTSRRIVAGYSLFPAHRLFFRSPPGDLRRFLEFSPDFP